MVEKEAVQLNSLSLAFLGDAVFTLYVRERLVEEHDSKSGYLHKLASSYVCATSQAKMFDFISDKLTETEHEIARRSRNCHNLSRAKNAALSDYKKATALEGVFGFLRITGQDGRLERLMKDCMDFLEAEVKINE